MSAAVVLLADALAMRARACPTGPAPCVITHDYWDWQAREVAAFLIGRWC